MHIEIHIFPDNFPIDAHGWQNDMVNLHDQITQVVLKATINPTSAAIGNTTLLSNNDSSMIVATIDIRRK